MHIGHDQVIDTEVQLILAYIYNFQSTCTCSTLSSIENALIHLHVH